MFSWLCYFVQKWYRHLQLDQSVTLSYISCSSPIFYLPSDSVIFYSPADRIRESLSKLIRQVNHPSVTLTNSVLSHLSGNQQRDFPSDPRRKVKRATERKREKCWMWSVNSITVRVVKSSKSCGNCSVSLQQPLQSPPKSMKWILDVQSEIVCECTSVHFWKSRAEEQRWSLYHLSVGRSRNVRTSEQLPVSRSWILDLPGILIGYWEVN